MDQELSNLENQFNSIIDDIKNSVEYTNYVNAKNILDSCSEASTIIGKIKELQKARNNCKHAKQDDLVKELTIEIDKLHLKYDLLFEVAQFNEAYEVLYNKVEKIKIAIENQIN